MAQSDTTTHMGAPRGTASDAAGKGDMAPPAGGERARLGQPSVRWLVDPAVFAVNRLPAHTDHMTVDGASGTLRQSLDGVWRAWVVPSHLDRLPMESTDEHRQTAHIPPAFASSRFDDAGYADVNVPGCLETQGLMRPQYVNIQYPWDGHEQPQAPHVPDDNLVALYRRTFDADPRVRKALSAGERVSLTFDGAATAIYVWLNGAFVEAIRREGRGDVHGLPSLARAFHRKPIEVRRHDPRTPHAIERLPQRTGRAVDAHMIGVRGQPVDREDPWIVEPMHAWLSPCPMPFLRRALRLSRHRPPTDGVARVRPASHTGVRPVV